MNIVLYNNYLQLASC